MHRFRVLIALVAAGVAGPAFAQEKAKDEKLTVPNSGRVALGGISSGYLYESHQKIGYVVDGYGAKRINLLAASKALGATLGLALMVEKQLANVANEVKLSPGDTKTSEELRSLLKIEAKSIESILAYWRDNRDEDLKAYETHRLAAWKGIVTTLDLGRLDKKTMQGTWIVTKAASDGEEVPDEALKALKFVIRDDVINFFQGKEASPVRIFINPASHPTEFDAEVLEGTQKGKTRFAIFEIAGDTMKLCWSRGDKRPTKFSGDQGPEVFNFELKRLKE